MNQQTTPPAPAQPVAPGINASSKGSSRYTTFFLVMLILSTIATFLALFSSLGALFSLIGGLTGSESDTEVSLAYVVISSSSILIINLINLVAIILLWFKKSAGFFMKMTGYLLSIASSIGLSIYVFAANPFTSAASEIIIEDPDQFKDFSVDQLATYGNVFFVVIMVVLIVINLTFALLWWFAWKGQRKQDKLHLNHQTPAQHLN